MAKKSQSLVQKGIASLILLALAFANLSVSSALASPNGNGLLFQAWNSSAANVSSFSGGTLCHSTNSTNSNNIDVNWSDNSVGGTCNTDYFYARWTGYIYAPVSGTYTFKSRSDDGFRVWVNNTQVINDWVAQGPTTLPSYNSDDGTVTSITLTAGTYYSIQADFYEYGGGQAAYLYWSYPTKTSYDIVPKSHFATSVDANLSSLTISQGTLSPSFSASTTSYTASVANDITSLTVTPTRSDSGATITVNGTAVSSGLASGSINLNVGSNSITVVVTAASGATKTYTITVTRANNAALTPTFDTATPTATGFTVQINNYTIGTNKTDYTWSVSASPGTATLNTSTGLVTVTGVNPNTSSTLTVTTTRSLYNDGSATISATSLATCAPSTDTTSAPGYTILKFTSLGSCAWTVPAGVTSARVLVIGGGGGSGSGGGGAGGFSDTNQTGLSGNLEISVGAGGSASPDLSSRGSNGSKSSFGSLSAGGGGGGGRGYSLAQGADAPDGFTQRGSGGGASSSANQTTSNSLGAYAGGARTNYAANAGGGGGGAGGAGNNNEGANAGRGGVGLSSDIEGEIKFYAGGGGAAGSGGGGNGSTNAGGGGTGGAGQNGIVVVRYANTYTVTFNYNGATGGNSPLTASYTSGSTAITLPTPTRTGYAFSGWYENETFTGSPLGSMYSPTTTGTIYAKWSRAEYIVTFNNNDGASPTISSATHFSGEGVTLPSPTRPGFALDGWYTAAAGGTKLGNPGDNFSPLLETNLVLRYEVDVPTSYSGAGTAINDLSPGTKVTGTLVDGPMFSTADGMSLQMDGSNDHILTENLLSKFGSGTSISMFTWVYPTGNGVIVSELGQRTIDDGWHDSQIEVVNGKLRFNVWPYAGAAIEAAGNYLNGWHYVGFTYSGTTLRAYVDGVQVGTKTITRERPTSGLYYGIGAEDYTSLGDGTFGNFKFASFHVYNAGLSATQVSNNFKATCARFIPSCEQLTIYAVWQASSVTVSFNANDASGSPATSTQSLPNGVATALTANSFTRAGYSFAGWNTLANGMGVDYTNQQLVTLTTGLTLYAKWTANTYTVTYDEKGGTTVSDGSFITGGGVSFPTSPTRTGFLFGGWSATNGGTAVASPYSPGVTSNITLYAVWISIAPPTSVEAVAGNQSITVNWTAPSTSASEVPTAYRVEYSTTGTGSWTTADATISSSARSFQITGLTNLTKYYVRVAAVYSGVIGAYGYPWTLIFETTTPNRVSNLISYTATNGLSGNDVDLTRTDFSRVRYFIAAKYAAGDATRLFVDANFDKSLTDTATHSETFDTLARLQVPTTAGTGSQFEIHGSVSDLELFSNSSAVTNGKGLVGRLEIWPWNYGTTASAGLVGGSRSDSIFDDGDFPTLNEIYGSFQLHNIGTPPHTVFAWNRHFALASAVEIGFGNNTTLGSNTDWTFAATNGMTSRSDFLFQSYANLSVTPVGTYLVTYDANSATSGSAPASQNKIHGTNLTISSNTGSLARTGFTFAGWNTSADGTGTDYAVGATYSSNQSLSLFAKWEVSSIEANGDAFVVSGTSSNTNYGTNTQLIFKNASNSTSNSFNRVSFAKFSYDANFNWSGSALEVYVSNNADGAQNNGYNRTYTTFNVDVYGASDASWNESTLTFNLANSSSQGWGINTATWPWNPDSATYLGTISIPTRSDTVGQKFALSSAVLDTFLNGDSDGAVTFYFRRSDVDGQANLGFASRENTSYPGPSLVVAGSGYTYTVAYDINGGTGTLPAPGTYTEGGSSYTIAATTGITAPANKTLVGWNTAKDGSGIDYAPGDSYSTAASLTLYAKYANFPTITFSSNYIGGPGNVTQTLAPNTSTALRQNTFTRTGFTFAGWDTQANGLGTDYADQASITTSSSMTLYAQWTASTLTVLYSYLGRDGGDDKASDTFTSGSGTPITLPTPTRTGYTFDGWYVGMYDTLVGAAGASYSPTTNVTLNAKWAPVAYSVTYNTTNSSGGSAPSDTGTYNFQQNVTVKANTGGLFRTGYTLAGWTVSSDGTGTVLSPGQTVAMSSTNLQLYPKWSPGTYTVSYHKNGASGDLAKSSDSFTTGGATITLPGAGTMTKTGHTFSHWSDAPTGSAVPNPYSTTQNTTLYAVWTLTNYNLQYNLNDGTGTTPTTQTANMTETVTIPAIGDAVKAGHWFAGWNTASDGSGQTYAPGQQPLMPLGGATLYAKWVPDTYQISYNANGGSGGPVLVNGYDSATFNSSYSIRAKGTLTRPGYNFSHWSLNQNGTGTKYDSPADIGEESTYTPAANTTFYAQWSPISYTFILNSDGGSATYQNISRTLGQTFTLPDPGTNNGYSFDGWSDGTNKYPIGSTYRVETDSKTLTAIWIPNVYTVTYDWQGGLAGQGVTPIVSATYTVGTVNMSLPSGTGYSRDGFTFSGWSTSENGSTVSNFQPTSDDILYAIWANGTYTLSYDGKGGNIGSGNGSVSRGSEVTLPTPVRAGFVFDGWFDHPSTGNRLGNGGESYEPTQSRALYARWIQKSLYGVDLASLETAATLSIGQDRSGGSLTRNHSATDTSASVVVPNGALPADTVVTARYFKEITRQADLIPGDNNYIFSLLVSWITGSGDTATVPNTEAGKPISVTLNSSAIKTGQMIYQVIGTQVTSLGRATQDGTITVQLTEDPEIVVAATAPSAPTAVSATAGSGQATVSWTAPQTSGGSAITGYTVTASPGGATCSTVSTTSCVVTGLIEGTSYSFSVIAKNAVGNSAASSSSGAISPLAAVYTVTYNSNGGSSVASTTFQAGGTVSSPTSPTRSGFTFNGWSTTLNDSMTKVAFPYSPPIDNDLTLYALWTEAQSTNDSGSGSGNGASPTPTPTPSPTPTPGPSPSPGTGSGGSPRPTPGPTAPPSQIGLIPTPPTMPVQQTGPVGTVKETGERVTFASDQTGETLIASAGSVKLELKPPVTDALAKPVTDKLELVFPVAARAQISGSGLQPNTVVEAWVFSEPMYVGTIKVGANGSFSSNLVLPRNLLPGQHTLQLGTLNTSGKLVTLSMPITVKGSVSVGTFRGFIAIYSTHLEGQEITAKVAGKWIRQNPVARFKNFPYSRLVRFTGAGYNINIDVYINKKFYKRFTTKTR